MENDKKPIGIGAKQIAAAVRAEESQLMMKATEEALFRLAVATKVELITTEDVDSED